MNGHNDRALADANRALRAGKRRNGGGALVAIAAFSMIAGTALCTLAFAAAPSVHHHDIAAVLLGGGLLAWFTGLYALARAAERQ